MKTTFIFYVSLFFMKFIFFSGGFMYSIFLYSVYIFCVCMDMCIEFGDEDNLQYLSFTPVPCRYYCFLKNYVTKMVGYWSTHLVYITFIYSINLLSLRKVNFMNVYCVCILLLYRYLKSCCPILTP